MELDYKLFKSVYNKIENIEKRLANLEKRK